MRSTISPDTVTHSNYGDIVLSSDEPVPHRTLGNGVWNCTEDNPPYVQQ